MTPFSRMRLSPKHGGYMEFKSLKWETLKIPPPNINWRAYRGLIMWKCTQPFLEFPVLPRATMNESEHINIFSRHKSYIFFTERNFCRGVIQIYFQQPEEDLDLDLLVPDYSQQVRLVLSIFKTAEDGIYFVPDNSE